MIARMMLQGAVAAALIAGAGMVYAAAAGQGAPPSPDTAAAASGDNGYVQPKAGYRLRDHEDEDDDRRFRRLDGHDRPRDRGHDRDHDKEGRR